MAGVDGGHGHGEGGNEDGDVPPHGDFGVNLHLLTVRVDGLAAALLANDLDDVLAVPNEHMGDSGTDGEVGTDLVKDLRGGEPGETDSFELGFVEHEVVVENRKLVEGIAVLEEESLGQEGEALRLPGVGGVASTESDAKERKASI